MELRIAPRQRAAFYELASALQRAADTLADTCPQASSMTPVGAIGDVRKKIEALLQSIAIVRPALSRFDEVLERGQRDRFAELM